MLGDQSFIVSLPAIETTPECPGEAALSNISIMAINLPSGFTLYDLV